MIATTMRGDGPTVAWIHGYTMDSSLWEPLWDLLPGYRHVGIDLPGHGASGPWPADATLPDTAAAIAEIVADSDARALVAQSFGSMLAVEVALNHPGVVERLILGAPTLAGMEPDPHARRRYQEMAMLYKAAGPGDHLADLWMTSPPDIFTGVGKHPHIRDRIRQVVGRHQWTELGDATMYRLGLGRHGPSELKTIKTRTLVLSGDEDMPAFAANARLLGAVVPDCHVETIPGAGHLPLLELPERVVPLLAAHLNL